MSTQTHSDPTQQNIQRLVDDNRVIVFMKGSRHFPQCGFSARVVHILDELLDDYMTVNVLADPAMRQGIKDFSDWPTIPQLYIGGEFLGGCDIVTEMYQAGELHKKLGVSAEEVKPPTVHMSDEAAKRMKAALDSEGDDVAVRVHISPTWQTQLGLGNKEPGDISVDVAGIPFVFDRPSAKKADGLKIDFKSGLAGEGFVIDNPNGPPTVSQMTVQDLKELLDAGEDVLLFDVRGDDERELVKLEQSVKFDEAAQKQIAGLPKDARLVFMCRSGGRSQQAAEMFLRQGYTNVHNVVGGILAWAQHIDPSLPTY